MTKEQETQPVEEDFFTLKVRLYDPLLGFFQTLKLYGYSVVIKMGREMDECNISYDAHEREPIFKLLDLWNREPEFEVLSLVNEGSDEISDMIDGVAFYSPEYNDPAFNTFVENNSNFLHRALKTSYLVFAEDCEKDPRYLDLAQRERAEAKAIEGLPLDPEECLILIHRKIGQILDQHPELRSDHPDHLGGVPG